MNTELRILLLEDFAFDAEMVKNELGRAKIAFALKWVAQGSDFSSTLKDFAPDLVLTDYYLPDIDGMRAIKMVKELTPDVPVIVITGTVNEETAVECMKAGATDYVLKEHLMRLNPAIQCAVEKRRVGQEKAQAERALRTREALLRSILETALDAVITMDAEGRVIEFNPAAEKIFGYSRPDAVGHDLADLIIPEPSRERHREGLAAYLATGNDRMLDRRFEVTGQRRNGERFPMELAITGIRVEGAAWFTSFIRDISEPKRAAEEREQLIRELQEALAKVKTLNGLLPICASCKMVRDDEGYWHQVEVYVTDHSDVSFTHSLCPGCTAKLYPDFFEGNTFDGNSSLHRD